MRAAFLIIALIASSAAVPCASAQNAPRSVAQELNELQPKINTAIDRGIEFLLSEQQRDGSWNMHIEQYHLGMTALGVYTLLKSGLPVEHSAIRRGLAYLSTEMPKETYSAGLVLMAFQAAGKPELKERIEAIAKDVMKWQQGSWGYPNGIKDLSNTQYAALGLRAAQRSGVKIPSNVWQDLFMAVLKYQEKEQYIDDKGAAGYSGVARVGAGFRYRADGVTPPTGSMTAAGIGCLAIIRECWPGMPQANQRQLQTSIDWGINWLGANFTVTGNPKAGPNTNYCYYMYGLERVGSLLKLEQVGSHFWYLEGARELVKRQGGSGDWTDGGYYAQSNTCFILLFLEKASAVATGGHEPKKPDQFASEGSGDEVRFRASGGIDGTPLSIWISGFSDAVVKAYTDPKGPVAGLRIAKVEYLVNDAVVSTIPGAADHAWTNEAYAAQWTIPTRGKYKIGARVTILDPKAPMGATEPTTVLAAKGFEVNASQIHEPWMDDTSRQRARSLWPREGVRAQASSEQTESGRQASKAIDGFDATCWTYLPKDKEPWITIVSTLPARANTIILYQMNGMMRHRGGHDFIKRVRIRINGSRTPREVDLDPEEFRPTVIELGEVVDIRKLEITVIDRTPGKSWPGHGGFSEIVLENRPAKQKK